MWTNAAIAVLAYVAVHTENLKAVWKAALPKPLVEGYASITMNSLASHFRAIIVDVVYGEEFWLRLTTTGANHPAVSGKYLTPKLG